MKSPFSITIDEKSLQRLFEHLFPGDDDEHGAVLAVGISESEQGTRLLVRDLFLAIDGVDYVPGTRGYRALTPQFIVEKSDYCFRNKLGYLAVHCHGGNDYVAFSQDDYNSHKRGYSALLDIVGDPVGALVFAKNAVAGEIWTKKGIFQLDHLTIIGSRIKKLFPNSPLGSASSHPIYDRHARLFGDVGQVILSGLKVGIIGLGGGGSLVNEWLTRLGVGHIVAIDFDKVESTNLPRIVGATHKDAQTWLTTTKSLNIKRLGKWLSSYKVHVAERVAKIANPKIKYDAVVGNILNEDIALLLKDLDFIFLATDSLQSRNVFNALLHQYLIPGAQIGAKVRVDPDSQKVIDITASGRIVLPFQLGGCLRCNGWIPPGRLQMETLSKEERRIQAYIESTDIAEPSVITLNVLSASQVVNDFMMMFTGLYNSNMKLPHLLYDIKTRELQTASNRHDDDCVHCGLISKSRFSKGDKGRLPCRQ